MVHLLPRVNVLKTLKQLPQHFILHYVYQQFQVIVEKAAKARIGDLDKKKYLVPSDLTGKYEWHCLNYMYVHV